MPVETAELPKDLRTIVREEWNEALDDNRQVAIATFVDDVIKKHPTEVDAEGWHLARQALIRWVTQIARGETEKDQLSLFGFPAVIAVPVDEDDSVESEEEDDEVAPTFVYMRTTKARWPEIEAGESLRLLNVRRAQQKLDAYRGAKERVRPIMEGTAKTLAEALAEAA